MKKYIIVAGTNGVGKSTLYETQDSLKHTAWVNTDDIVRSFGNWTNISDVTKEGKIAVQRIRASFEKGVSFGQETTLCGRSILRNIEYAREIGYYIELHYVGVESVQVAKERVAYPETVPGVAFYCQPGWPMGEVSAGGRCRCG